MPRIDMYDIYGHSSSSDGEFFFFVAIFVAIFIFYGISDIVNKISISKNNVHLPDSNEYNDNDDSEKNDNMKEYASKSINHLESFVDFEDMQDNIIEK